MMQIEGKKKNVGILKAKINTQEYGTAILPVAIPELSEVTAFAGKLHAAGNHWTGEFHGWQCEYRPQHDAAPLDSKMSFTPAHFWIGESGIWFFSLMWEDGKDLPPQEFLDNRGVQHED